MNSYWCYGDLARANWGKCHIVVNLGQRVYATMWWEDWQDNQLRFLAIIFSIVLQNLTQHPLVMLTFLEEATGH